MKLLCRPDYYTEHRDNNTARKISLHVSEVYDNLLKNTNILSKEIGDRVNYETTQRFYLPKFHFKRPE